MELTSDRVVYQSRWPSDQIFSERLEFGISSFLPPRAHRAPLNIGLGSTTPSSSCVVVGLFCVLRSRQMKLPRQWSEFSCTACNQSQIVRSVTLDPFQQTTRMYIPCRCRILLKKGPTDVNHQLDIKICSEFQDKRCCIHLWFIYVVGRLDVQDPVFLRIVVPLLVSEKNNPLCQEAPLLTDIHPVF